MLDVSDGRYVCGTTRIPVNVQVRFLGMRWKIYLMILLPVGWDTATRWFFSRAYDICRYVWDINTKIMSSSKRKQRTCVHNMSNFSPFPCGQWESFFSKKNPSISYRILHMRLLCTNPWRGAIVPSYADAHWFKKGRRRPLLENKFLFVLCI